MNVRCSVGSRATVHRCGADTGRRPNPGTVFTVQWESYFAGPISLFRPPPLAALPSAPERCSCVGDLGGEADFEAGEGEGREGA